MAFTATPVKLKDFRNATPRFVTIDDEATGDGLRLYQIKVREIHTPTDGEDLVIYDEDGANAILQIKASGAHVIGLAGQVVTLPGDLRLQGNLIHEGETVVEQATQVLYDDNHLFLNNGYKTAAAQTGGLAVNYLPVPNEGGAGLKSDTVAAGGFTAGVAATSNPTVATTSAAKFAVGELIQIDGANKPGNNGLFEVLSHAANVLTIRGIGLTACVEDFTQNQFSTDPTVAGSITKVTVSVIRAGTDGAWEVGSGSSTGITFENLATTGSLVTDLDSAYDGGHTITVDDGPVALTQAKIAEATGTLTIAYAASEFTGTPHGIVVDMSAASSITNAGDVYGIKLNGKTNAGGGDSVGLRIENFDVGAEIVGDVAIQGASFTLKNAMGTITGITWDGATITLNAGALLPDGQALTFGTDNDATIAWADGDADLDVTVTGTLDVNVTGAIELDATAASNFTLTADDAGDVALTIAATNAGAGVANIAVSADGAVDIDAGGALSLNSSGAAINIGNDAVAQAINIGTGAAARTITIGNASGATAVDINLGTGAFTVDTADGGSFSIDSTGAPSNIGVAATADGDDLTIAVTGAFNASLLLQSAGTGADAIGIAASAGGVVIDAAAALDLNSSGGAINIGNDAVDQAINLGTAGTRTISIGSATATINLTGDVTLTNTKNFGWGMTAGAIAANQIAYLSGNYTVASVTAAEAGNGEKAVGVWDGTRLVPNGGLVTVAKTAGFALSANEAVYLSSAASSVVNWANRPTAAGTWLRRVGYVVSSALNADETARILVSLDEATQN